MSSSMSSEQTPPTQPSAPAEFHRPSTKTPRVLACQLCQHRKIKCDRNFPCNNCQKAGIKCSPSVPAPARKRRRPNQDLQERIIRLESLVEFHRGKHETKEEEEEEESCTSAFEEIPTRSVSTASISTAHTVTTSNPAGHISDTNGAPRHGSGDLGSDPSTSTQQIYEQLSKHGRLVTEDGGKRFMDSVILGTIYDELRAMRDIVSADESDDNTPATLTPDNNAELVLGTDTPASTSAEDLWPQAGHIFRLWQIYLDRVNPLTKIIHVPTLQRSVVDAASGPSRIPDHTEALLFSIWLMAAVAMTPEECQDLLGCSRDTALHRFSNGVRMTLTRLNFLSSHNFTVLQALVIYLISLLGRYNRHSAWILNGVVIRIAQKMGLHRDGEMLGLSPFDTEMRRRLWWQIIMLDAKYAMMTGLNHSSLPRNWDTKEPRNINDVEMFPQAREPFQDRDGPTEMIFVMITNKLARFLVDTPGLEIMLMLAEASGARSADTPEVGHFRGAIANFGQDLLRMLEKYCDPTAGPVHQMAVEVKKQIIHKLTELATQGKEQPEWGTEMTDSKDNAFKLAICAMEHESENYHASADKGFLWHALLHFQLDVFVYLAGQLCHRLDGTLVERAWRQVEVVYSYHPELYDTSNKNHLMLARFILKAWTKRAEFFASQNGGRQLPMPGCIGELQKIMPRDVLASDRIAQARTGSNYMVRPQPDASVPSYDMYEAGAFMDGSPMDWGDMLPSFLANGLNDLPLGNHGMSWLP